MEPHFKRLTCPAAEMPAATLNLTLRQLEVLALLCEGLPNKLICRRLEISAGTAKAHISSILRELGVSSRLQAVLEAGRQGLVADGGQVSSLDPHVPHASMVHVKFTDRANHGTLTYAYSRN